MLCQHLPFTNESLLNYLKDNVQQNGKRNIFGGGTSISELTFKCMGVSYVALFIGSSNKSGFPASTTSILVNDKIMTTEKLLILDEPITSVKTISVKKKNIHNIVYVASEVDAIIQLEKNCGVYSNAVDHITKHEIVHDFESDFKHYDQYKNEDTNKNRWLFKIPLPEYVKNNCMIEQRGDHLIVESVLRNQNHSTVVVKLLVCSLRDDNIYTNRPNNALNELSKMNKTLTTLEAKKDTIFDIMSYLHQLPNQDSMEYKFINELVERTLK